MIHCMCFDGGGVRGVMSARLVARLLEQQENLVSKTQVFGGTSIGAYLAAGLAMGVPIDEIEDMMQRVTTKTFDRSLFDKISNLWGWDAPAYSTRFIKSELKKIFGEKTIGDLKKKIIIASFQLSKRTASYPAAWTPVFFHNIGRAAGGTAGHSKELKIYDALLRSSAAPTYFPIYQNHIDGGIIANNPSMAMISQIIHSKAAKIDEIVCLSVGTGYETRHLDVQNGKWGLIQWLRPNRRFGNGNLIHLLMDGPGDANHFYAKTILAAHYHRLQIQMVEAIGMSESKRMDELLEIADKESLDSALAWLQGFWYHKL